MPSRPLPHAAQTPCRLESIAVLAILCAILFLPGIGARDLWAPDEPRFAEVAREMVQSGDWIVLRDNNHLYTHKPPLLFWLIALFSLPFGAVTEVSARLPIALCGIGTVGLTAALGRLWFGRFGGWAAGIVLATSYRFFVSSQWVQTDGPLALCTTLSIYGLARVLEHRRATAADLALVHGGVAGALLAKGPVGLLIPLLCAIGWAVSEGGWGYLRRLRPWLLAVAALPVLAWGVEVARAASESYSLMEAVREHVLERFAQGMHHPRPSYYFLHSFPLELMPWTVFLAAWAIPPWPLSPAARAGRRRALIWLLAVAAMFTLSTEKRPVYLLPIFPAACLFLGGTWPSEGWFPANRWDRWRLLAPFLLLALLAAGLLAAAPLVQGRLGAGGWSLAVASSCALAAALGALRAGRTGQGRAALGLAAGSSAILLLGLSLGLSPVLDQSKSARPLSERIVARMGASGRLGMYRFYRSAYVFYTGRFLQEIETLPELEDFLTGADTFCIIDQDDYHRLPAALRRRHPPLEEGRVGHRLMLLIGGVSAQPVSEYQSTNTIEPRPITMRYSRFRTMRPQDQGRHSASGYRLSDGNSTGTAWR